MRSGRSAHLDTGIWGENQAARFLKRKRYKILGRRVRVGMRDEIDLIARDRDILVFVEVKTRGSNRFGRPVSAVDTRKRQVLSRAAVRYIGKLKKRDIHFRFDVVEIVGAIGDRRPTIEHIENAFPLDSRYTLPA